MLRVHATIALILAAAGTACGGDERSSCTIKHDEDGTSTLSCADGTSLVINTPPSAGGANSVPACTVKANPNGTKTVACSDGTSVTVRDEQAGTAGQSAASSCTIGDNGDGTKTVSCPDGTSVTVRDEQAETGGQSAASSCTIRDNGDGTKTVSCTDGTSVTVREEQSGAGGTTERCSSSLSHEGSLCATAFPRRIVHACREEDTFLGIATAENWLQSPADTLTIDLTLRAKDSAFDEPVSCAANFADCQPLVESAAGFAPPEAECSSGQCFSEDIPSGKNPSSQFIWKLLNQAGAGTMAVELPPGVSQLGPEWQRATAVILQHNAVQGRPQTLVLYWNGFARLKTLSTPDPCFGSSVVLPPFEPVAQPPSAVPRPELHPVIETISLLVNALGRPQLRARGAWYDAERVRGLEVEWNLVMDEPPASGEEVQWHVSATATPNANWAWSTLGSPSAKLIGIGAISSMYSAPGSFDSDVFSVTPGRPITASSLVAPMGASVNGAAQPLPFGATMTMARSQPSDHNASAADLSLTLVGLH